MIGCLRYGTGFETLRERDVHVRSHNRPSKCPERGCFYEEVGFANERTLNQHISLCHTDPSFNRFEFPKFRKPPPPAADERKRFREAIRREDLGLLRDMIHTNASLRDQLSSGSWTGLGYAAYHGKLQSVRCLLECGCNIGAVSDRGTALHGACHSKRTDIVQFLLSNSTSEDVNRKDKEGRTPLSYAARWSALEMVRLILEHGVGVDVNAKDSKGRTPLSMAVSRTTGMTSESVRMIKALLEQDRVDVDAKDAEGRTPLSWAASESFLRVVRFFLECGEEVDVNSKDNKGRTPLSWAASRWTGELESPPVVKVLLEQDRVDVDAKDDDGRTPLSWAASKGHAGTVRLFLRRGLGVAVNSKDKGDRTPLSWALARGDSEKEQVVKILVQHGGIAGVL